MLNFVKLVPCLLVHVGGQRAEPFGNLHRVFDTGFKALERFGQPGKFARSALADLREGWRRPNTFSATHDKRK